ncbi:NMDA receptor-regulated protein 1 family protein [Babesia bovis T2Bo]|uniref:Tetratricopeptide repeat containing domain protein n=1 Tax=Babesia bovis TaxID=5865 RepID=A7ASF8_BABBO|nr:NMDA receptor-regulated protein 1 family protein [Babesia bovis T2Bo]EDO07477.1 NMDA receptor-regulated protein 1 family protein [Babesia bovis T2Bo]|eukprot:XP_001611045.1 tetratricopeptide repeat containing domain protein [Babesia bovis T2Bo]
MANHKNDKNTVIGEQNQLTSKDVATFKTVMDLYNQKQYKKGLKTVEGLLAKHPKYGEALSFKALFLSHLEPSLENEIMDLAKEGLKNDVKSYICWYVLGAIYKQRKLYKDTFKCFSMALRIDPKNDRLMKDISAIAIEIHDYVSFRKMAKQILEIKLKFYKEWMAFAFSQHLCQNIEGACRVAQEANTLFDGKYEVEPFELSSSMIYWASILEESGKYEECIKVLNDKKNLILDNIMRLEYIGRAAIKAKIWDVAHDAYAQLVEENPDNARYTLLFIATHCNVRVKSIFQMPLKRNIINTPDDANQSQSDSNVEEEEEKYFEDAILKGMLPPIILSEEILDIEGVYSTSNWCYENTINRTYDKFVNAMRQKAETKVDATNDEKLFLGCYCYGDYVTKIAKTFDIKDLDDPQTVDLHAAESILTNYFSAYPIARNTLYTVRPKIHPWSRYPLYIFTRDLTSDESNTLLDVLNLIKKNNYLGNALHLSFVVNDHIKTYHAVIKPLIEAGCLSIFKYFSHACTINIAYRLLVLLECYRRNLKSGFLLEHGIETSTSLIGETKHDISGYSILAISQLDVVNIFAARIYDYLGQYHKGLDLLEQTIKTSPLAVDAYMMMGKIYKHLGDFAKSKQAYCMASDIDRSDRQTSSKAAKALLRAREFEASVHKWKSFLVEDVGKQNDKDAKKNEKNVKTKDAPPEVKSMKFELMAAEQHCNIYLEYSTSKPKGHNINESAIESLQKAHDIYSAILERQHEVYMNQLDFHNYCINRLQYQTYYIFNQIRSGYTALLYFIEAAKGILWTTAEMHKQGIVYETACLREFEEVTNDHNIDYCIDMIKCISSQRVFNTSLYSAIYEFTDVLELPMSFKIQCLLRTYETAHKNPMHHHLYPMVVDLIRKSYYKHFPKAISSVLPPCTTVIFDEKETAFRNCDGRCLSDAEAAHLYIDEIMLRIKEAGVMDTNHCEAIAVALHGDDTNVKQTAEIYLSYSQTLPTYSELYKHYWKLRKIIHDRFDTVNDSPLKDTITSLERALENRCPGIQFNFD